MDVAKLRRDIITDTVFGWALRIEAFVIVILLISAEFIFGYTTSSSDAVFTLLISFLSLWLSRLFFNMAKRLKGEVGNAITKHEQSN